MKTWEANTLSKTLSLWIQHERTFCICICISLLLSLNTDCNACHLPTRENQSAHSQHKSWKEVNCSLRLIALCCRQSSRHKYIKHHEQWQIVYEGGTSSKHSLCPWLSSPFKDVNVCSYATKGKLFPLSILTTPYKLHGLYEICFLEMTIWWGVRVSYLKCVIDSVLFANNSKTSHK